MEGKERDKRGWRKNGGNRMDVGMKGGNNQFPTGRGVGGLNVDSDINRILLLDMITYYR